MILRVLSSLIIFQLVIQSHFLIHYVRVFPIVEFFFYARIWKFIQLTFRSLRNWFRILPYFEKLFWNRCFITNKALFNFKVIGMVSNFSWNPDIKPGYEFYNDTRQYSSKSKVVKNKQETVTSFNDHLNSILSKILGL